MLLRRLSCLAVSAALALSVVCAAPLADGSAAASVKPQCAAASLGTDSQMLKDLSAVVGENLVQKVFGFIRDTPMGKILVGKEGVSCVANMNGTVLGQRVQAALKTTECEAFNTITEIPFINQTVNMLGNPVKPTFTDTLKLLKLIPSEQMDQFCSVYTDKLVPCLTAQLLPALAVVRAQYSNGCCDAWVDDVLDNYGYSLSGQLTKLAQLAGEVMCSTQTPSFSGKGSQRCGYTWIQSIVTKPDVATVSASVLKNLQVPTDQMCLRAEGMAYKDVNDKAVEESTALPFPSGCVAPLDRLTTWVAGLPAAKKAQTFDVQALFANDECLNGADFYPVLIDLIPELAADELQVYFSKSCVHLPTKFADKCTYSRPVSLIKWASEPSPAKETAPPPKTQDGSATVAPTSTEPAPSSADATAVVSMVAATLVAVMAVFE